MITIENRVGRLIETRFIPPLPEIEFGPFERERERLMRSRGRDRLVCIDLSRIQVLPPAQADFFIQFLRQSRPGLTRNAFLLPPGQAILALQVARVLREANNPCRRAFQSATELIAWLGEMLQPAELVRLTAFLSEVT